jgi:hypothetical protein
MIRLSATLATATFASPGLSKAMRSPVPAVPAVPAATGPDDWRGSLMPGSQTGVVVARVVTG